MPLLLQVGASAASHELPSGYGVSLLQSLLALALVCILAWVVLRFFAARGVGVGLGRRVKVLERVPLDARRWIYLVELGDRVLVLGVGDGASPTLLKDLPKDALPEPAQKRGFLEALEARRSEGAKRSFEAERSVELQRSVEAPRSVETEAREEPPRPEP